MKLDYIYHSGFAIEADGVTVIIDYYKDSSETEYNKGIVHDYLLGRPGELYVLSSHFHPDHFNREVLLWKVERPDIHYIFSKDILKHRRATREDATYINKGDVYEDPNIRIEAFGSTDVGISFLIDLQGIRLFHAGDLNGVVAHFLDLLQRFEDERFGFQEFPERVKLGRDLMLLHKNPPCIDSGFRF